MGLKGNDSRKRYIIVEAIFPERGFDSLDSILQRSFRSRRKFTTGRFAVYLTNQFLKSAVIAEINKTGRFRTIRTSGSMKKCKEIIDLSGKKESGSFQ